MQKTHNVYNKHFYDTADVEMFKSPHRDLDKLYVIGKSAYLSGWNGNIPNLISVKETFCTFSARHRVSTRSPKFFSWGGKASNLKIVGGECVLTDYEYDLPSLEIIGKKAYFQGWKGSAPQLKMVNNRKFIWKGKL